MADNKKQHFVPRFYLKSFSSNDEKSICIYNINSKHMILDGNLKNQCYRNYLYGKDGKIEKNLGPIEGQAAAIIRDAIATRRLPPSATDLHFVLLAFVLIQWGRTMAAGAQLNGMMDIFYHQAWKPVHAREAAELGVSSEEMDELTIGYSEPERASMSLAAQFIPLAMDLRYKLLERQAAVEFITSDNTVVFYNQLAHGKVPGCTTGIPVIGLQIFMPITKDLTICFYDSAAYKVGSRKSHCVPIADEAVRTLNLLQTINAQENIYFASRTMAAEVQHTANSALSKRTAERTGWRTIPKNDGEVLHWFRSDINHKTIFSFNKMMIPMSIRFDGMVPPRRSIKPSKFDEFADLYQAGEVSLLDLADYLAYVRRTR